MKTKFFSLSLLLAIGIILTDLSPVNACSLVTQAVDYPFLGATQVPTNTLLEIYTAYNPLPYPEIRLREEGGEVLSVFQSEIRELSWGGSSYFFRPQKELKPNTKYEIEMGGSLGELISSEFITSSQADTTPPAVEYPLVKISYHGEGETVVVVDNETTCSFEKEIVLSELTEQERHAYDSIPRLPAHYHIDIEPQAFNENGGALFISLLKGEVSNLEQIAFLTLTPEHPKTGFHLKIPANPELKNETYWIEFEDGAGNKSLKTLRMDVTYDQINSTYLLSESVTSATSTGCHLQSQSATQANQWITGLWGLFLMTFFGLRRLGRINL